MNTMNGYGINKDFNAIMLSWNLGKKLPNIVFGFDFRGEDTTLNQTSIMVQTTIKNDLLLESRIFSDSD